MKVWNSSIIHLILRILVVSSVIILFVGCSSSSDDNVKTIRTYLENELTGPSDELINALDNGLYPPELLAYLEENYNPLVADLDKLLNSNLVLIWLRIAAANGYQLRPTNIDIQKIDNIQNDAYNFEVYVEYSKDGQTKTDTITGIMNLNDDGKIITIRNIHGFELIEKMK